MDLTGLEMALLGILGVLIGAFATWFFTRNSYVTTKSCNERHEHDCEKVGQLEERLKEKDTGLEMQMKEMRKENKRNQGIIFNMLRAITIHLDVPKEKQVAILNDRGED